MGKKIILPWTCETGDKIKTGVKWSVLIALPMILVVGLTRFGELDGLFMILIGGIGTLLGWIRQIIGWYYDDVFPSFICKCKKPNDEEVVS